MRTSHIPFVVAVCAFAVLSDVSSAGEAQSGREGSTGDSVRQDADSGSASRLLLDYYHQMSVPKPFVVRTGKEFTTHQAKLRRELLESTGLWPLPERVALDVHQSESCDHPWCMVRRIYYQLWPGVYSSGLLFMPKEFPGKPAPAMLCPHGHWKEGNADPEVQRRCLNFARMGYVTFSSTQEHYEDLNVGVSHQTLMIWNNMRALDYLEQLPEVDKTRIGVAGASGGGLQAQMLVALDPRVKAATMVGLTCDFREIMFPDRHHCVCNHFPRVMQFTDHPEISALGLPAAVQYLTMNDWTRNFEAHNLPTIQELYEANGYSDRVDCKYFDTPHSYDKPKRERTYWWMEKWVRGNQPSGPVAEPDEVTTFLPETLKKLATEVPANKGLSEISRIYRQERGYKIPDVATRDQWLRYRQAMIDNLKTLLGLEAALPQASAEPAEMPRNAEGQIVIQRASYPSEDGIRVPTAILHRTDADGPLPTVVILDSTGRESLLAATGPDSARTLAGDGWLVVLPDVRCFGELSSLGGNNSDLQRRAWERNGIVWGRPVPGMACTDIRAVLDGLSRRADVHRDKIKVVARGSGDLAVSAIFAAGMDPRITSIDVDMDGCCFDRRNLAIVPYVLQHGDVLQWAALLADRNLTIRNVPEQAGDPGWLRQVFAAAGNRDGLQIDPR